METPNSVDTSRFKNDALCSDSYFMWCCKVQLVLCAKGERIIVSENRGAPDEISVDAIKGDFEKRRDVALTTILLSIGNLCVGSVIDLKDSIEVWTRLQELYQTVFRDRTDTLLEHYQYIRMKPSESVMSYVNCISVLEKKARKHWTRIIQVR